MSEQCPFCKRWLPTAGGLRRHLSSYAPCKKKRSRHISGLRTPETLQLDTRTSDNLNNLPVPQSVSANSDAMDIDTVSENTHVEPDLAPGIGDSDNSRRPTHRATVEEVEDSEESEEGPRAWYTEAFPPDREAGHTIRPSPTTFEQIRDSDALRVDDVLGPFEDEGEWELAKWLVRNVGHTAGDQFLKLPSVSASLAFVSR